MTARKWRLVEGSIYKLSEVFENCVDALNYARVLNREHQAIMVRLSKNEWAVYWRSKDEVQCKPSQYGNKISSSY